MHELEHGSSSIFKECPVIFLYLKTRIWLTTEKRLRSIGSSLEFSYTTERRFWSHFWVYEDGTYFSFERFLILLITSRER